MSVPAPAHARVVFAVFDGRRYEVSAGFFPPFDDDGDAADADDGAITSPHWPTPPLPYDCAAHDGDSAVPWPDDDDGGRSGVSALPWPDDDDGACADPDDRASARAGWWSERLAAPAAALTKPPGKPPEWVEVRASRRGPAGAPRLTETAALRITLMLDVIGVRHDEIATRIGIAPKRFSEILARRESLAPATLAAFIRDVEGLASSCAGTVLKSLNARYPRTPFGVADPRRGVHRHRGGLDALKAEAYGVTVERRLAAMATTPWGDELRRIQGGTADPPRTSHLLPSANATVFAVVPRRHLLPRRRGPPYKNVVHIVASDGAMLTGLYAVAHRRRCRVHWARCPKCHPEGGRCPSCRDASDHCPVCAGRTAAAPSFAVDVKGDAFARGLGFAILRDIVAPLVPLHRLIGREIDFAFDFDRIVANIVAFARQLNGRRQGARRYGVAGAITGFDLDGRTASGNAYDRWERRATAKRPGFLPDDVERGVPWGRFEIKARARESDRKSVLELLDDVGAFIQEHGLLDLGDIDVTGFDVFGLAVMFAGGALAPLGAGKLALPAAAKLNAISQAPEDAASLVARLLGGGERAEERAKRFVRADLHPRLLRLEREHDGLSAALTASFAAVRAEVAALFDDRPPAAPSIRSLITFPTENDGFADAEDDE